MFYVRAIVAHTATGASFAMQSEWEEQSFTYTVAVRPDYRHSRTFRLLLERGTVVHVLPNTAPHAFHGLLLLFPHGATERVAAAMAKRPAAGDASPLAVDLSDDTLRSLDDDILEQPSMVASLRAAAATAAETEAPLVRVQAGPELVRRLVCGVAPAAALLDLRNGIDLPPMQVVPSGCFRGVMNGALGIAGDGRPVCVSGAYNHETARMVPLTWSIDWLKGWALVRTRSHLSLGALRKKAAQVASDMIRTAWIGRLPSASCDAPEDDAPYQEAAAHLAESAGPAHAGTVRHLLSVHLRGLGQRRAAAAAVADVWCRYAGAPWGPTARYIDDVQRGWRPASDVATDGTKDIAHVVLSNDARRAYDAERTAALRLALRQLDRPADRVSARRMPLMELRCLCARSQRQQ